MAFHPRRVLLAFVLLVACGRDASGPDGAGRPSALTASSGNGQIGTVGMPLPAPIVVRVTDPTGTPVVGATVAWSVASGGGTVSPTSASTDASGLASAAWTMGTIIGDNAASAKVGDVAPVAFTAAAKGGAAASITIAPDSVELVAGSTQLFTTEIKDQYGNVVTPTLTWSSSDSLVARVDSAAYVVVRKASRAVVTASSETSSASAVVHVRPGAPAAAEIAAGNAQTALADTELADSLATRIVDRFGNGVPGMEMHWSVFGDGGTVSPASNTTDSTGIARTRWTLGRHAGTDTVAVATVSTPLNELRFLGVATPNATIMGTVSLTSELTAYSRSLRAPMRVAPGAGLRSSKQRTLPVRLGNPHQEQAAPLRLIVRYRPAALAMGSGVLTPAAMRASAARISSEIRDRVTRSSVQPNAILIGVSPALLAARLEVANEASLTVLTDRFRADPSVASVEREVWYQADHTPATIAAPPRRRVPNDPLYVEQAWNYGMIGLPRSWKDVRGSASVVVAVVDDGIHFTHPDIAANLTADGYDFVSTGLTDVCGVYRDNAGDGDGYDRDPTDPMAYDCSTGAGSRAGNHGLHVAGTIGAVGDNGVGVAGINWAVKIRPVRVLGIGGGSNYDVAQGILYAAGLPADDGHGAFVLAPSQAKVINLSLGGPDASTVLHEAVIAATNAGSLLIAAAGNDGVSTPGYPAAFPEVLSVSAVGAYATLASYSNYGSTIDISAPGGNYSDGGASFMIASTTWDFVTGTPNYAYYQGTSMAAPHVAGVAALILSQEPGLTGAELRARLTDYAVDYGTAGRDDRFGAGIVNARNSLAKSRSIPGTIRARAYDARSGKLVQEIAATGSSYRMTELPDAPYQVFAGIDEGSDGLIGVPGTLWGGLTAAGKLTPISVDGAGNYSADFLIGYPIETEPNNDATTSNRLVVGGYLHGALTPSGDADVYTILVPAGTYTFETSGWNDTACGYAYAADTRLELRGPDGSLLGSNDDVDLLHLNFCSRVSLPLAAGSYTLTVSAAGSGTYYRIEARAGS